MLGIVLTRVSAGRLGFNLRGGAQFIAQSGAPETSEPCRGLAFPKRTTPSCRIQAGARELGP